MGFRVAWGRTGNLVAGPRPSLPVDGGFQWLVLLVVLLGRRFDEVWFGHGSSAKKGLADHGDYCYVSDGRARERGGGTRERSIDMGAPLRGHGRAVGRPGAPFKSTPERHDHAIHL